MDLLKVNPGVRHMDVSCLGQTICVKKENFNLDFWNVVKTQ